MWILQSTSGGKTPNAQPLTFRIPPGSIRTIGRAQRADIILDVALVSRLHCRLEARTDALDVIDLASTNGTFVNGKRIDKATLVPGDRLRIGRVELTIDRTEA